MIHLRTADKETARLDASVVLPRSRFRKTRSLRFKGNS